MAVVDLPYGTVRRHLSEGRLPGPAVEAELAAAARDLLAGGRR